jgi:hypothetical protein
MSIETNESITSVSMAPGHSPLGIDDYTGDTMPVDEAMSDDERLQTKLENYTADFKDVIVTDSIATRDTLSPEDGTLVVVTDATDDPSVDRDGAMYAYNAGENSYTEVVEDEITNLFAVPHDPNDPIDWNDLEVLYKSVAETIGATAYGINEMLNVPGIRQGVEYPAELAITVNGLNKDLNHFADKLVEIYDQHKGQTGVITDQDQYIDYLSIGDQYRIVAEEFMAITAPAMMTVASHISPHLNDSTETSSDTSTDGATDDTSPTPTTHTQESLDV